MPRLNEELERRMADAGYVTTAEAARLSGHARTSIMYWIDQDMVKTKKSGSFWFIEVASLAEIAPLTETKGKRDVPKKRKGKAR